MILQNKNVKKEIIPHGNVNGKYCITKYELDVKNIVVVREHKFFFDKKREIKFPKEFLSDAHYGEAFKTLCNIMVVEEVISLERIQEFVEILTGGVLKISQGSLVNWIKKIKRMYSSTEENENSTKKFNNDTYRFNRNSSKWKERICS